MNHQQPVDGSWTPEFIQMANGPSAEAGLMHPRDDIRVTVGEIAVILRRSAIGVAFWISICLGIAGLYLAMTQPTFVASSQIVLEPRRQILSGSEAALSALAPALDSAQAESQIQVVKSERNLRFVFDTLDLANKSPRDADSPGWVSRLTALLLGGGSPEAGSNAEREQQRREVAFQNFKGRVVVARIGQSYVLDISVRAPSADEAAHLSNSITASYIRDQIQFRAASIGRGTEFLQGRISDVASEVAAATAAVKSGIIPDLQFPDADVRVVSSASPPLGKSYPQSKLIVLLAAVFAILTTVAYALVLQSLDHTVRTRSQLSRTFGLDCLSVVPHVRSKGLARGDRVALSLTLVIDAPVSAFTRTLRVLRASLFSSGVVQRRIAVGIVSCSPREGRSTISANLAFLLAASAEDTVLIDGDFRNPALTSALAPKAEWGLNDELQSRNAAPRLPEIEIAPSLTFVPAISAGRAADPNVFIGSNEMRQMMVKARIDRNIVVDLPPLGQSSDAQAIGHMLDGVMLIVEAHRTTLADLSEAIRALRKAEVRLLGVVLNKSST